MAPRKLRSGEVIQPLGKAIRAACIENRNWRQELQRFSLSYRSTPHATTKIAPSELLYNRVIRGKLPCLVKKTKSKRHREAQENDVVGKGRSKAMQTKEDKQRFLI